MYTYLTGYRDSEGTALRNGDVVMVTDRDCYRLGVIMNNPDCGNQHMVKVIKRRMINSRHWYEAGKDCTEWVILKQRNKGIFRKKLRGVYLKERIMAM